MSAADSLDVRIFDDGSIVLLKPLTDAAVAWVEDNVSRENGFQPYWPTVVVEPRFVRPVLQGMSLAGLSFA